MQPRLLYKFVDWQDKCDEADDESSRPEPAHVGFTMTGNENFASELVRPLELDPQ
jgi:hypothetical protein